MTSAPPGGFAGRTALVTGAAGGIGRGVARALARRGAFVIATDVDGAALKRLGVDFERESLPCATRLLDVADGRAVEALVQEVERERPIDLLASVAGVLQTGPTLTVESADWERTFRINAQGVFHVCQSVGRRMVQRRAGAILAVSSNAARCPRMQMAAYAASKAAASMFIRCLGLELAQYGVRCNVVAPGSTDTPMQRQYAARLETDANPAADDSAAAAVVRGVPSDFRLGIPLGRLAAVPDVVEAVLFLLSDSARHITMHELVVDGGATLGM